MIGVLVFPDFQLLDATGPISVFEIAGRFAGQPSSIRVLAENPGPVRSSSGVEVLARGLRSDALSTLIVAGGEGVIAASKSAKVLAGLAVATSCTSSTCAMGSPTAAATCAH